MTERYTKCAYCGHPIPKLGISIEDWNELVEQDIQKADYIEKLEAEKDCLTCKVKNLEDSLADAEALVKAVEQENKKLKAVANVASKYVHAREFGKDYEDFLEEFEEAIRELKALEA